MKRKKPPTRTCSECKGAGGREPVILRRNRWIKCPACKGSGYLLNKENPPKAE
jgi:DnaJ-class molecular chaperone